LTVTNLAQAVSSVLGSRLAVSDEDVRTILAVIREAQVAMRPHSNLQAAQAVDLALTAAQKQDWADTAQQLILSLSTLRAIDGPLTDKAEDVALFLEGRRPALTVAVGESVSSVQLPEVGRQNEDFLRSLALGGSSTTEITPEMAEALLRDLDREKGSRLAVVRSGTDEKGTYLSSLLGTAKIYLTDTAGQPTRTAEDIASVLTHWQQDRLLPKELQFSSSGDLLVISGRSIPITNVEDIVTALNAGSRLALLPFELLAQRITPVAGAKTGQVDIGAVVKSGATGVIIGHSETRPGSPTSINDGLDEIRDQLEAAVRNTQINTIILAVGEEREDADERLETLTLQLGTAFLNFQQDESFKRQLAEKLVIAYEPRWAIAGSGQGKAATVDYAQAAHREVRGLLEQNLGRDVALSTRIIYGGSADATNAASFLAQEDIDGLLPGGASKSTASFLGILRVAAEIAPDKQALTGRSIYIAGNQKTYPVGEHPAEFIRQIRALKLDGNLVQVGLAPVASAVSDWRSTARSLAILSELEEKQGALNEIDLASYIRESIQAGEIENFVESPEHEVPGETIKAYDFTGDNTVLRVKVFQEDSKVVRVRFSVRNRNEENVWGPEKSYSTLAGTPQTTLQSLDQAIQNRLSGSRLSLTTSTFTQRARGEAIAESLQAKALFVRLADRRFLENGAHRASVENPLGLRASRPFANMIVKEGPVSPEALSRAIPVSSSSLAQVASFLIPAAQANETLLTAQEGHITLLLSPRDLNKYGLRVRGNTLTVQQGTLTQSFSLSQVAKDSNGEVRSARVLIADIITARKADRQAFDRQAALITNLNTKQDVVQVWDPSLLIPQDARGSTSQFDIFVADVMTGADPHTFVMLDPQGDPELLKIAGSRLAQLGQNSSIARKLSNIFVTALVVGAIVVHASPSDAAVTPQPNHRYIPIEQVSHDELPSYPIKLLKITGQMELKEGQSLDPNYKEAYRITKGSNIDIQDGELKEVLNGTAPIAQRQKYGILPRIRALIRDIGQAARNLLALGSSA